MSNWHRKVEYTCECGQNYGSCGQTGKMFLRYQGVSDTYQIFIKDHPDQPVRLLGYFDDQSLEALGKLVSSGYNELAPLSDEEFKEIQLNR
jgi:uncharacterized protein YutD